MAGGLLIRPGDDVLAERRKAAFAKEPTGPNQVWQLDFSEFETATGGTWRIAGCRDYWSKYQYPFHVSPTANQHDAIDPVELALADYEELLGHPMVDDCPVDEQTGEVLPVVTIVTDNGGPFRSFRFEAFIELHPELADVRTRVKSLGQNRSRERGFGTLKYERLFIDEIDDAAEVANTALWIAQLQGNAETELLTLADVEDLPLREQANIAHANALTTDWAKVVPPEKCSYIIGNPPFRGSKYQSAEQKGEIKAIFDTRFVRRWSRRTRSARESRPPTYGRRSTISGFGSTSRTTRSHGPPRRSTVPTCTVLSLVSPNWVAPNACTTTRRSMAISS